MDIGKELRVIDVDWLWPVETEMIEMTDPNLESAEATTVRPADH